MTEILVFGTIAGALVAWAAAETLRSQTLWTLGAVLTVVHSAAAFHVFHGWSHDRAVEATAAQTSAVTGLAWGGGVYFNYALLVLWTGDAIRGWRRAGGVEPGRSGGRRPIGSAAVRAFVWFMFVNGAVVFADGAMRVLGVLAVGSVTLSWLTTRFRQPAPAR